ncbi:hypothetical protein BGP_4072 [Beggiatoa sp. PS]|nr:hypothetical protein BGP_4072 [Beggiatoa sp. PS]
MKISGFTFIRNGTLLGYPYSERLSLRPSQRFDFQIRSALSSFHIPIPTKIRQALALQSGQQLLTFLEINLCHNDQTIYTLLARKKKD